MLNLYLYSVGFIQKDSYYVNFLIRFDKSPFDFQPPRLILHSRDSVRNKFHASPMIQELGSTNCIKQQTQNLRSIKPVMAAIYTIFIFSIKHTFAYSLFDRVLNY